MTLQHPATPPTRTTGATSTSTTSVTGTTSPSTPATVRERLAGLRLLIESREATPVRVLGFGAAAISRACAFARELIDRLVRTAAPGFHFVACVTRRVGAVPRIHAGIVIVRPRDADPARPRARISPAPARDAFAALLAYGRLSGDPVAMLMRSCDDDRHDAAGHGCVIRGWISRDGRADPMRAATVRNAAGGHLGPHPCLPPHPQEGVRYETAYPLHPADPDLP